MKARIAVLFALAVYLLVSGAALAQSNGPPPAQYVVARGAASGGHYRLTSLTLRSAQGDAWQASGASSGGGYRLAGPASPAGTGTPCCCNYLPCMLRNH